MQDQRKRRTDPPTKTVASQPKNADTINLTELMYRLLGSWKLILTLALLLAVAAGFYTAFFVTPLYEATSTIYVLGNSNSVIDMSDLQIGSELTSDYIKVFKMWEVHEAVISALNLPYSYKQMRSMLTVTNDADTRMLDITITSPDPQEAADIANKYAEVASDYIAETMVTDKPSIMSVALVPSSPASPNKTKNVMMGFLLGALLAAGYVTVRMLMDDRYKTAEDIRKYTGLTTLAVIPVEETLRKSAGRRKR